MSQQITIPLAVNGLDKLTSPVDISGFSPNMQNAFVEGTQIRKRLGYSSFGSNLPLTGVGQELIRYVDNLGAIHLIALTSTNAYHYNTSSGDWDDITPVAPFSGTGTRWSWDLKYDITTFPNNGGVALVICNDVDGLYYFEGQTGDKFQALDISASWDTFVCAKEVVEYFNHLFVINYTEVTRTAKGLVWADLNSAVNWSSGTYGNMMISGLQGTLVRAVKLSGDLVLYADDSIGSVQYVGGNAIFVASALINSIGLFAERGICELETFNLILGSNYKIYAYYGNRQLEEIGQKVQNSLFGYLDVSKKQHVTSAVDEANKRAYIFIPGSSDDYSKYYYCLNYKQNPAIWEAGKFAHNIASMSYFDNFSSWRCNDTQFSGVDCTEVSFYCNAAYTRGGYKQACFLSPEGYVYKMDDFTGTDETANIEFIYETPDITVDKSQHFGRWTWFCFQVMSRLPNSTCLVKYSTDSGTTWTTINNEENTSTTISIADGEANTWDEVRLPIDVVSRTIRFQIYQDSDTDLRLRNNMYVTGEIKAAR